MGEYENSLFISDLDGTLLDSNSTVPERAVKQINTLINSGVKATFATARTHCSVERILGAVEARYPVALMNGVVIRDLKNKKNLSVKTIYKDVCMEVYERLTSCGINPFIYFVTDDDLIVRYTEIDNFFMNRFMEERVRKYDKKFYGVSSISFFDESAAYFVVIGEKEKLFEATKVVSEICGINAACYGSTRGDEWYLEIFSDKASKRSAALEIKEMTNSDKLISFGDNLNDLSMFEVSDESYAASSGVKEVMKKATGVVEPPYKCGVTKKIAELTGVEIL